MHFLDCGDDFTYDGKAGRIHASLMPDGVNLNAAGMEQLATCLQPVIQVSVCPSSLPPPPRASCLLLSSNPLSPSPWPYPTRALLQPATRLWAVI